MIWLASIGILLAAGIVLQLQRQSMQKFLLQDMDATAPADHISAAFHMYGASSYSRLGQKIFSDEDLELLSQYPPAIRKNYLLRKKAAALQWLAQGRTRMRLIMRAHRRAVRNDSQLDPREEISLFVNYRLFLLTCVAAEALTLLIGPLAMRRLGTKVYGLNEVVMYLLLKSAGIGGPQASQVA
jgi:hypothetical protein